VRPQTRTARPSHGRALLTLAVVWFGNGPARAARATDALSPTTATADPLATAPPPLGWSSWSSTWASHGRALTEAYVGAQADAMADKLRPSGYQYVNLDDGWSKGFDEHGRPQPDPGRFPNGIAGLAEHVHAKGLKLGVYLTPGLRVAAWKANGTVAGTQVHLQDIADPARQGNTQGKGDGRAYKIDYARPGAKEYVQSCADLLASWGVDYIKMDFVGPGGGNVRADTRDDIRAWHDALRRTGRPVWLELSNKLSIDDAATWKAYSNGWRIENDVEGYGKDGKLTRWAKVAVRFTDAPRWASFAGPGGWNDLDSLEVGNGDRDGLTPDERRTTMTLWAICCSPLIVGADLTDLDAGDLALLTNAEVLAIDQAGHVATPLSQAERQQVWRAKGPDGTVTVALFNLGNADATVSVTWAGLGLVGRADVRDLWAHRDLGPSDTGHSALLSPHACQLLCVRPK
jgi:alpha-galactosidase